MSALCVLTTCLDTTNNNINTNNNENNRAVYEVIGAMAAHPQLLPLMGKLKDLSSPMTELLAAQRTVAEDYLSDLADALADGSADADGGKGKKEYVHGCLLLLFLSWLCTTQVDVDLRVCR